MLLLLADLAFGSFDTSCDDDLQEELRRAKDRGSQYLAKKHAEAGVLKKPPSLLQMGSRSSFKITRSVPAELPLMNPEVVRDPSRNSAPSFKITRSVPAELPLMNPEVVRDPSRNSAPSFKITRSVP
eukprot:CAMPEP_0115139420 /NCGR_PEP_ID=MMETSP0227-20121206/58276_1 /TAXON_ID=89957 /ORGANISM="Polarella glacialis, Strain CCMP 1383" /LENGTH=126 /DNA_ID=CAMNT_0002547277 /DNA_START=100 /DNA_END=477 /DNA_ORIENTATION=-